jgi:hypothetical protein
MPTQAKTALEWGTPVSLQHRIVGRMPAAEEVCDLTIT